jgi:hypothetical protein
MYCTWLDIWHTVYLKLIACSIVTWSIIIISKLTNNRIYIVNHCNILYNNSVYKLLQYVLAIFWQFIRNYKESIEMYYAISSIK